MYVAHRNQLLNMKSGHSIFDQTAEADMLLTRIYVILYFHATRATMIILVLKSASTIWFKL